MNNKTPYDQWMDHQLKMNREILRRELEHMDDSIDRKADRIKQIQLQNSNEISTDKKRLDRGIHNLTYTMGKAMNSFGKVITSVADPVGYMNERIEKEKEITAKRNDGNRTLTREKLKGIENMVVSEETYNALQNIAILYDVKWTYDKDKKVIIGTLSNYLPEDHEVFNFIAHAEILDEIHMPQSKWKFLKDHFQNVLYIDGSFKKLDFFEKIVYKLLPKVNHIKSFSTTEEHFMKVYKLMTEEK